MGLLCAVRGCCVQVLSIDLPLLLLLLLLLLLVLQAPGLLLLASTCQLTTSPWLRPVGLVLPRYAHQQKRCCSACLTCWRWWSVSPKATLSSDVRPAG
jgi:hypothetical protein